MGYSHGWYRPKELDASRFAAFSAETARLARFLQDSGNAWRLRGPDGTGEPVFTAERVAFNGDAARGESFESYEIPRVLPMNGYHSPHSGLHFQFCKTQVKPYDILVCSSLLSLKHHFPEVRLCSDGTAEDWSAARRLYRDVLGREAPSLDVQEGISHIGTPFPASPFKRKESNHLPVLGGLVSVLVLWMGLSWLHRRGSFRLQALVGNLGIASLFVLAAAGLHRLCNGRTPSAPGLGYALGFPILLICLYILFFLELARQRELLAPVMECVDRETLPEETRRFFESAAAPLMAADFRRIGNLRIQTYEKPPERWLLGECWIARDNTDLVWLLVNPIQARLSPAHCALMLGRRYEDGRTLSTSSLVLEPFGPGVYTSSRKYPLLLDVARLLQLHKRHIEQVVSPTWGAPRSFVFGDLVEWPRQVHSECLSKAIRSGYLHELAGAGLGRLSYKYILINSFVVLAAFPLVAIRNAVQSKVLRPT